MNDVRARLRAGRQGMEKGTRVRAYVDEAAGMNAGLQHAEADLVHCLPVGLGGIKERLQLPVVRQLDDRQLCAPIDLHARVVARTQQQQQRLRLYPVAMGAPLVANQLSKCTSPSSPVSVHPWPHHTSYTCFPHPACSCRSLFDQNVQGCHTDQQKQLAPRLAQLR